MRTSGASSVDSKIVERTQTETPRQGWCARGAAWYLAKDVHTLQKESQDTFSSPAEAWVMPAPSSTKPEEGHFMIDPGASMHKLSKKDLSSREVTSNGEVQTNEEAQVYVHDLHIFVTVQLLEDTPAALFLGKLCKEHGYTCERPSGREPRLNKNGKQTLCKTENFVPLLVPRPSSSSTTTSSSTSPPQDLSLSLDPVNTRSTEGATGNCSEEVAGNCNEGVPEWLEDFTETSRSQKYPQPQRFLMTQIRNIPQKWLPGSTVFILTSQMTKIVGSASLTNLQGLLAEGELGIQNLKQRNLVI